MSAAKDKKYGAGRLAAVFAAGLLCGLLLGLAMPFRLPAAHAPKPDAPAPDYETTGFWGDFDEIRLFRYYLASEIPDISDVPDGDAEYNNAAYEHVSTDGPVDMGFGPCWEAVYREKPAGR